MIGLYVDDQRSEGALNVTGPYKTFSYYVWCRGGENGMSEVRYAIRDPYLYDVTAVTVNDAAVAVATGFPIDLGSVVSLDGCQEGWVGTHRIDCISVAEGEEFISVVPLYGSGELGITNCLYGDPSESAIAGDSIYLFIDSPLATLLSVGRRVQAGSDRAHVVDCRDGRSSSLQGNARSGRHGRIR